MAAAKGSTDTQSHAEFSTSDPDETAKVQAAHAAGMQAHQLRQQQGMSSAAAGHAGQLAEAPSTMQPTAQPGPWAAKHQSSMGSSPASTQEPVVGQQASET